MKILIVTPIFPPEIGGPATYTLELARRLRKKHDVSIIAFGDDHISIEKDIPLHMLKVIKGYMRKIPIIGSIVRQLSLLIALIRYGLSADIWYLQGPLIVGYVGSFIGRLFGKTTVMKFVGDIAWETAHRKGHTNKNLEESLEKGEGGILRSFQKEAFRKVNAIVVPSEYLRDILVTYYSVPVGKVHVIYNAVSASAEVKKRPEGRKVFVVTGRLVPHKNVAGIIEAMALLKGNNYELKVVGDGPEGDNLRELARKLDVNVKFLGPLSRDETLKEVANADLFILNSNYEGLPHSIVEAMYLRTSVIATDIPGTDEVANVRTAIIVEPNNPEDLAAKIKLASTINLTENAYEWVTKRFNWTANLGALQSLFSRLCQK